MLVALNTAGLEPGFLGFYSGSAGSSLSMPLCPSSHGLDDLPARRAGATACAKSCPCPARKDALSV